MVCGVHKRLWCAAEGGLKRIPDFARPHLGVLISERSIGAGSLGGFFPRLFYTSCTCGQFCGSSFKAVFENFQVPLSLDVSTGLFWIHTSILTHIFPSSMQHAAKPEIVTAAVNLKGNTLHFSSLKSALRA